MRYRQEPSARWRLTPSTATTATSDCASYHDFHEMFARNDIDAVMIAVPDRIHAVLATEAAALKKDIYGEKPLAHTIVEQQAIVKAVEKNNLIWQTGSWQRSLPQFYKAVQIVRNGLIGNVTNVEVGLPGGHHDFPHTLPAFQQRLASLYTSGKPADPATIVPGTPAWDLAVTPPSARLLIRYLDRPFQNGALHRRARLSELALELQHRRRPASSIGSVTTATSPTGASASTRPVLPRSKASENSQTPKPSGTRATKYTISCIYRKEVTGYANDVKLAIVGGSPAINMGTKWIGTDGWVWVDRSGFDASNPEWVKWDSVPESQIKTPVYHSTDHWANFIDCVTSRKPTIAPVNTAHHSTIPGHLGLISMLTGRKIQWDVAKEEIINDPRGECNAVPSLSRPIPPGVNHL